MLLLSSCGCCCKHVLSRTKRTSFLIMLNHGIKKFRDNRPAYMAQYAALASPLVPPVDGPWQTLWHFLCQDLGLVDVKRFSISHCKHIWPNIDPVHSGRTNDAIIQDNGYHYGGVSSPYLLPSVMFVLNNKEDRQFVWNQYNTKRGALAAQGIHLINLKWSHVVNQTHRVASHLLPGLERQGRTVQFLETGVSVDGCLYEHPTELNLSLVPHHLFITSLGNQGTKGNLQELSRFLFPPSAYLLKAICSRLGLADPEKAFSGLCSASGRLSACGQLVYVLIARFENDLDKRRVINAFREFVQSESYDGMLKIRDSMSPHRKVSGFHILVSSYVPSLRKMGVAVKLTDSGILLNDELFTNGVDFANRFFQNMVSIFGIPEPLMDESEVRKKELVHMLACGGLKLPRDDLLDIAYVGRMYRRNLDHRIMLVTLVNDKEKERLLEAYFVHRWPLIRKGIAIRDMLLPSSTWRIHLMAMILLGGTSLTADSEDDAIRIALRDSCIFTETGVVLDGKLFRSVESLERRVCDSCSKKAEELIPMSWSSGSVSSLLEYVRKRP